MSASVSPSWFPATSWAAKSNILAVNLYPMFSSRSDATEQPTLRSRSDQTKAENSAPDFPTEITKSVPTTTTSRLNSSSNNWKLPSSIRTRSSIRLLSNRFRLREKFGRTLAKANRFPVLKYRFLTTEKRRSWSPTPTDLSPLKTFATRLSRPKLRPRVSISMWPAWTGWIPVSGFRSSLRQDIFWPEKSNATVCQLTPR